MRKVLVSACLMGRRVRYDGRAKPVGDDTVTRWREEGRLVVHCPEIAGGCPYPDRPPRSNLTRTPLTCSPAGPASSPPRART